QQESNMQLYDLHTHTNMSDARFPIEDLVEVEHAQGHILGVSDHFFCCGIYTLSDIKTYLEILRLYPVYRGAEVNMEHRFNLPDSLDDELDYIIASVHSMPDGRGGFVPLNQYFSRRSGYTEKYDKNYSSDMNRYYLAYIIQTMEKTFSTQRVDILGHATVLPPYDELYGTNFLTQWEDAVIGLCKKHDVALEISGLWRAPRLDMLRRAHDAGLKFSMGSDCHDRLQIGNLQYVEQMIDELGLQQEDFFIPKRQLNFD
ncbi:MAG: PHP domain-containing protein, partial [Eubacteriales bacterium]|nr:PHP domain-containing protein [Eubacteriales bacterium]